MNFLRFDTRIQGIIILVITLLCVYLVFVKEPLNKSVSINLEFKQVDFVAEAELNNLLKDLSFQVEKIESEDKPGDYVSARVFCKPLKDIPKSLSEINSKELETKLSDYFGRLHSFAFDDTSFTIEIEKLLAFNLRIRKALEPFGLSNSFISNDAANPLKASINCGNIPEINRKDVKEALAKIGKDMVYELKEKGSRIKLGLDLRSGTHLRLQLLPNPDMGITQIDSKIMADTLEVLDKRINELGTFEPIIQSQPPDFIIVDLPEVQDPEAAIEIIQKSALLEFKEQIAGEPNAWKTVMTGNRIKNAAMVLTGGAHVEFELTAEGAKEFAVITERNVGKPLAIYFDGKEISAPVVQDVIAGGSGRITLGGKQTKEAENEAASLARFLRAGALPVPIKIVENQLVSPTLGSESLHKSLWAGIIGLSVVCLFMIYVYKLPGLLADIALVFYALVLMGCFADFGFVLNLPGIAGFILSIGMAVDANVLIFERLREELWAGKTVSGAINTAFNRAWTAVLDTHVTTFLGAVVMYMYGSSSVKGFGLTLALGTAISLITAVFVTRVLVDLISHSEFMQSKRWLYGE